MLLHGEVNIVVWEPDVMILIEAFFITIHRTQFIQMTDSDIKKQRKPDIFSTRGTSNLQRIFMILIIICFNVTTKHCLLHTETYAIE